MALETASYVGGLVGTNPTATDPKSQGDDHLRLVKTVLQNTFAGFPGMAVVTGSEAQGGTVNDYTLTLSPAPAAYTSPLLAAFKATHANTGAATVQIGALGTKPLIAVDGTALKSGDIESGGLVAVFYDGTSFVLISGNDRANRNGETYSGTHDFSAASISLGAGATATTPTLSDSSTKVATTAFAAQLAFQASLPAQTSDGVSRLLRSLNGVASWGPASLPRSPRTSNTLLGVADAGTLIDITSGTFTQTFAAAATLGSGWYCYIRNSGTGDITLDPNGAETIDGLTSLVMYPNEVRLVQCDGSSFVTISIGGDIKGAQIFTASGTFFVPKAASVLCVEMLGGGGGGAAGQAQNGTSAGAAGGGGSGYLTFTVDARSLPTSFAVTVGAGGSGGTAIGNAYGTGGNGGSTSVLNRTAGGGAGGTGSVGTAGGSVASMLAASLAGGTGASSTYAGSGGGAGVTSGSGGNGFVQSFSGFGGHGGAAGGHGGNGIAGNGGAGANSGGSGGSGNTTGAGAAGGSSSTGGGGGGGGSGNGVGGNGGAGGIGCGGGGGGSMYPYAVSPTSGHGGAGGRGEVRIRWA